REAFGRLGETHLALDSFTLKNPAGLFVPASRLNQLRRDLVADLEESLKRQQTERLARLQEQLTGRAGSVSDRSPPGFRWSIKVDRIGFLDALEDDDLADVDEVIVDITRDHPTVLLERLGQWSERLGRDHLRLALPALTRFWEEKGL